jgi:Response regulators consisting of a CheY-like receiver domain and a winged-helix DNA-binding domain
VDVKIKLLIADDNIEFASMLSQYARNKKCFEMVEVANDGLEALEKINRLNPDIVILDLIMPQLDGIGLLEKMSVIKDPGKPSFIVLSAIGQDSYVKMAMNLGASYYMVKPFDVDLLITRVYEIYMERNSSSNVQVNGYMSTKLSDEILESEISKILHRLAVPPNLSGYRYLKEAIKLSIKDSSVFNSVTKLLYPKVAQIYSSSSQKVERSIRNAIDSAWKIESNELRDQLFSYSDGKPSNSQFISTVVEGIKGGRI